MFVSVAAVGSVSASNTVTVEKKWRYAPTVEATADDDSIDLSWEPIDGADRYSYRWQETGGSWSKWFAQSGRTATIDTLSSSTRHTIFVRGRVDGAWKAYTRVDISTTAGSGPPVTTVAPSTTVTPATTLAPTTTVAPTTTTAPATTVAPPTTPAPTTTMAPATTVAPPTTTTPPPTTTPSPGGRPDIVLIITDDQSVEDMQWMPWTHNWFTRNGAEITNHRTALPWCCPNRASIQSGVYAHNHLVWSNNPGFKAFDTSSTIATWLDPTYETVHIGKALNNTNKTIPPGWDHWCATINGDHKQYNWQAHCKIGNQPARTTTYGSGVANFQGSVYADMAEDVIEQTDGRLMLYYSMSAPHVGGGRLPEPHPKYKDTVDDPLPQPPGWRQPSNYTFDEIEQLYRRRAESLKGADDQVRQIIEALDRTGRLDNTVVMFISDNGFLLGEHGMVGKNIFWSEAVNIPAYIAGPGVPRNSEIDEMTSTVDIASTIAAAAGVTPSTPVDGLDLRGNINDDRAVLVEGRRLQSDAPSWWMLETNRFVLVERASGWLTLYDKSNDPHQLKNLSNKSQFSAVKSTMRTILRNHRGCRGSNCVFTVDNARLDALAGGTAPPTTAPPTPVTTTPGTTSPPTPTTQPPTGGGTSGTLPQTGTKPGLVVTVAANGSATATVLPPAGATRYQVRWRAVGGKWIWADAQNSTTFTFNGVNNALRFQVRVYNDKAWQTWNELKL